MTATDAILSRRLRIELRMHGALTSTFVAADTSNLVALVVDHRHHRNAGRLVSCRGHRRLMG